jgi:hypothetical protein
MLPRYSFANVVRIESVVPISVYRRRSQSTRLTTFNPGSNDCSQFYCNIYYDKRCRWSGEWLSLKQLNGGTTNQGLRVQGLHREGGKVNERRECRISPMIKVLKCAELVVFTMREDRKYRRKMKHIQSRSSLLLVPTRQCSAPV